MHMQTGNRDAVDYYATQLKYHVDFGPEGTYLPWSSTSVTSH